mmetsp:Transcript_14165/g.56981  ORF Transcript_14165/g.56981 Transcript_14165/m.56981 type:complete len:174 (-) Transcript_14165:1639-2160(-)
MRSNLGEEKSFVTGWDNALQTMTPQGCYPQLTGLDGFFINILRARGLTALFSLLFCSSPDLVFTNALVVDWTGIFKADVGVKDGRIVAIGKAGNPDIMDGVHPKLIITPCTEIISAEGKILTAGGVDTHVHYICPQIADEALASGVTTLYGGGTGPASGEHWQSYYFSCPCVR